MTQDVRGHDALGIERRGQDKANLILFEDVGNAAASAGFRAAIRGERHAESATVKIRRLLGVAYIKLQVIDALQGKKIGGGAGWISREAVAYIILLIHFYGGAKTHGVQGSERMASQATTIVRRRKRYAGFKKIQIADGRVACVWLALADWSER